MGITAALNTALSGLGAAGRSAQVVSSNISNALTDGYGRREIDLATSRTGGVQIAGVSRTMDPALLSARRGADAETGLAQSRSNALGEIAASLGPVGDADSLSGRIARFDALLLEAASRPDSVTRLEAVAAGGRDLVALFNKASQDIQDTRLRADRSIADQMDLLTFSLNRVDALNGEIQVATLRGADLNALKDLRQAEVDKISAIVPLRIMPRNNDAIALISQGGQILLEGRVAEISYTPANGMSPTAVLGTPLSGLTIDGRPIDMSRDPGRMSGGTLQAAFETRDQSGPQAQAELDAVARDLIERFQDVDPTLAAGLPGLFTDAGAVLAASPMAGLAGRIELNAIADPAQGGDAWTLRSGLGSVTQGPPGDASLLRIWRDTLNEISTASAPELAGAARSLAGHSDELMALANGRHSYAEAETSFNVSQLTELQRQELELGVDTDDELQKLLLIERIYGANTKVIQAADAMLQRLLEI